MGGEPYDVAIVGGGIVGLMLAYKLAHYDVRTLVIEACPEPGWGVSKAHAAVVHVVQLPFSSLKSRMAREGNRQLEKICRELGVRFERTSSLAVAMKLHHFLAMPLVALYLKLNLGKEFPVKLRGRSWLRREEPALSKKALGAIEVEGYGLVDNFDLLYGLYEFARENGVDFAFGEKVSGISVEPEFVTVKTSRGEYRARYVVNAAGLWADEIAKMTGDDVDFELGKGALLVFERRVTKRFIAPLYLKPDPKTKGGAIMYTVDGRGLWGPNLRPARGKSDTAVDEEDVEALMRKFSPLLDADPGIPLKAYAGIRPIPPENDFRIVYSKASSRVVHAMGTESPAFTASPVIADKIIAMLREAGLTLKPKAVKPRRPFPRLRDNPEAGRGRVVCACSLVTEEEVREAVRRGSRTLQGVMFRTGAGMGVCQGSRCAAEVMRIIAEELGIPLEEVTLRGGGSWLVKK
ncbi:MAG: NAD(P)/FAD-dependent oxidoreductase [Thermofilum sp.]